MTCRRVSPRPPVTKSSSRRSANSYAALTDLGSEMGTSTKEVDLRGALALQMRFCVGLSLIIVAFAVYNQLNRLGKRRLAHLQQRFPSVDETSLAQLLLDHRQEIDPVIEVLIEQNGVVPSIPIVFKQREPTTGNSRLPRELQNGTWC